MSNTMASGPPPSQSPRRRNVRPARTQLPAEGRKGPTPPWPLARNLQLLVSLQVAQETVDTLKDRDDLTPPEKRKLNKALESVVFLGHQTSHVEDAETELWVELWTTPQAVAWERLRFNREVAQYVRWKIAAEWGDLDAAKEARQLSDRLGLTPMSMLRLQWEIAVDETAEKRAENRQAEVKRSPRSRMRVVADDAVEGTGT